MALLNLNVLLTLLLGVDRTQKHLNFTELTQLSGYKSEEHTVVTEDGYVLNMFRITRGAKCVGEIKQTPVFFMPPLLSAADTALEPGPNAAMPYLISDACYDIWVGNPRGTYYGRRHMRLDPDKNKEFWQFSMNEIGTYDVPAMVDYVLDNTKKEKLMYIGFSQGGGSFFVMCSERPDMCQKIKLMIGLAPATRLRNTKSVFLRTLCKNAEDNLDVFDRMQIWEVFGRDQVTAAVNGLFCRNNVKMCEWFVSLVDSSHPGSVASSTYKTMLERFPAGTSIRNLVHFSQGLRNKKFVKFNHGTEKNLKVYGHPNPPEYNLTAADLPILLITGRNDAVVDVKDVKWLARKLPELKEFLIVEDPMWNHVDMFYSKFIKDMIFPKILNYLLRYNEN
ncbi:lipase member K-like [Cydia fagiglandana]|uniref:lipase member K-like n=1 Tax=Cydia fagiglandana TaxID=1458189 RepID=UPI002FEDEF37